jgi:hypothetical protein
MMIGYDIYDCFTMEHFRLRQRMTLASKIYRSRLYITSVFLFGTTICCRHGRSKGGGQVGPAHPRILLAHLRIKVKHIKNNIHLQYLSIVCLWFKIWPTPAKNHCYALGCRAAKINYIRFPQDS